MFLLFFLIFTLVFTVFQNIQIAGISLVLVIIFLTIYQFISKKEILCRQIIFSLLGGFLLAIAAFGIKEIRYYGGIERWIPAATLDPVASTGQAVGMRYNGNGNTFVGTGIISDISGQGKYVFSYKNTDYLLYSEKKYTIGDVIWLVGNMDSGQIPARFRLQHLTPE
jgi:hypothetical protein